MRKRAWPTDVSADRRKYLNGPFGQIHIHLWGDIHKARDVLICLPPSPYSGRAFDTIAPHLAKDRCVIAVDYPRLDKKKEASIAKFALVAQAVVNFVGAEKRRVLVGFHTGCLVAAEASLICGSDVDRIIIIDVPFFTPEVQAKIKAQKPGYFRISKDFSDLQSAWDRSVGKQRDNLSALRSFELFVDHISAGHSAWYPFAAAFTYDCASQFSKISTSCYVIATQAGLHNESLSAALAIERSVLIETPEIKVSVLEAAAEDTAIVIQQALEE